MRSDVDVGIRCSHATCPKTWLIPLVLVAVGVTLHLSGLDRFVSDQFFDASAGVFARRHDQQLELWGHLRLRSAVVLVWLCTLFGAFASLGSSRLRPYRSVLWSLTAAMVLGPLAVVVLKNTTSYPCPWDLHRYGGSAGIPTTVFAVPTASGRCFPSGHSAGGFSLVAFYFAAIALRRRRLAKMFLLSALIAGTTFSAVRIVQGAHFLSHAFWAAAIDWVVAALVFAARARWTARRLDHPGVGQLSTGQTNAPLLESRQGAALRPGA